MHESEGWVGVRGEVWAGEEDLRVPSVGLICNLDPLGSEHRERRGMRIELYTTPKCRCWEDEEEPGEGSERGE